MTEHETPDVGPPSDLPDGPTNDGVPAAAQPSRRWPWQTRALIGVVLVAGGVYALLGLVDPEGEQINERFQGVTSITLDLDSASVEVTVGGSEVVVDRSVTVGFMGGTPTSEQVGVNLRLEYDCPPVIGTGCRGSYSIRVPEGTSITGGTSNGPITLTGIDGLVDVSTSNGPITLDRVESVRVDARTSNGRIIATGLRSPEVEVRTSNGRVSLHFDASPTRVSARSSNGEVEVMVPSDSPAYAVSASTSNGQTRIDIRTDPASTSSMTLSTSNGDITAGYRD